MPGAPSARRSRLREAQAGAETALKRLHDAAQAGTLDPSEPTLRSRIAGLRARRDTLGTELEALDRRRVAAKAWTPDVRALERLASRMRQKLQDADPTLRRKLVRMFVGRVEVGDRHRRLD